MTLTVRSSSTVRTICQSPRLQVVVWMQSTDRNSHEQQWTASQQRTKCLPRYTEFHRANEWNTHSWDTSVIGIQEMPLSVLENPTNNGYNLQRLLWRLHTTAITTITDGICSVYNQQHRPLRPRPNPTWWQFTKRLKSKYRARSSKLQYIPRNSIWKTFKSTA